MFNHGFRFVSFIYTVCVQNGCVETTVCQRLCARNRLAPDDLRKVTKPHRKMSICSFLTRWFFSVDETNQISLFTELEGVKSSQH